MTLLDRTSPRRRDGFTLVELSIALVIIALLVAGIVAGAAMLKGYEIRSQVSQIGEVNAGVAAFRLKYACLPGDCAAATRFFPAPAQPAQVTNGNGDGIICGTYTTSPTVTCTSADAYGGFDAYGVLGEWFRVFDHLAAAGLTAVPAYDETDADASMRPGVGYPKLKIVSRGAGQDVAQTVYRPGGIAVAYHHGLSYLSAGHKIKLGLCRQAELNAAWPARYPGFLCGLHPSEAYQLDAKIDDGRPYSGAMVLTGISYTLYIPGGLSDSTLFCGIYAENRYRNESEIVVAADGPIERDCSPTINAQF